MAEHAEYVVADFNGDGNVDMVVTDFAGNLKVLLGSGSVFTVGQSITLGAFSFWMDKGDFDHDGDLDIVLVQKEGQAMQVLTNDGNAQFSFGQGFLVPPGTLQVLVADANVDGKPDLLLSHFGSPEIIIYHGDGLGGFVPAPSLVLPGGGESFTFAVGDPTGDGRPDLVVCDPTLERVLVFAGQLGAGQGLVATDFATAATIMAVPGLPGWCSVGDVSGDGRDDIVVSAHDANQFVVITAFAPVLGTTTYTSFALPVDGHPAISTIGDVSGDGRPDLVACVVGRQAVYVFPQQVAGNLGPIVYLDASGLPTRPVVVDVDGNGKNDLLALSGFHERINLWLASSAGALFGSRGYPSGLVGGGVLAVADLDRDGVPEVIAGSETDTVLAIMRPSIDRRLLVVATVDVGANVRQIRAVDLDRDGRLDLVVSMPTGVRIVRNQTQSGVLQLAVLPNLATTFGNGAGPFGVAAADLDRDGRLDLAIADYFSGDLQILRGGQSPFDFSAAPLTLPIGGNPVDVGAADYDGDGILDLAISRRANNDIVLFHNDGHLALTQFATLPVGAAPNFLLSGDLDGDGRSDLVVANGDADTVSVLYGGPLGFRSQSFATGGFPDALAVADLTDDGLPDVLVAARTGEDFRVLVNDGHGGFSNLFPFPGVQGAFGVALADLDGDGDRDLILGSVLTDRVSVVNSNLR